MHKYPQPVFTSAQDGHEGEEIRPTKRTRAALLPLSLGPSPALPEWAGSPFGLLSPSVSVSLVPHGFSPRSPCLLILVPSAFLCALLFTPTFTSNAYTHIPLLFAKDPLDPLLRVDCHDRAQQQQLRPLSPGTSNYCLRLFALVASIRGFVSPILHLLIDGRNLYVQIWKASVTTFNLFKRRNSVPMYTNKRSMARLRWSNPHVVHRRKTQSFCSRRAVCRLPSRAIHELGTYHNKPPGSILNRL